LSAQTLDMGREQMGVGVGLADLAKKETKDILSRAFETGQEFTPNQVEDLYSKKLEELMMKLSNKTGGTITEAGEVPGPSTQDNIVTGINTALGVWNAASPYQDAIIDTVGSWFS